jgi:hypothetical protein
VEVVVDGYESSYYEWCAARALEPGGAGEEAAMRRARLPIESLRWGVAPGGEFCLRLDPDRRAGPGVLAGLAVELRFASAESGAREVSVSLDERGDVIDAKPASVRARARKILEMTVPAADAGLVPGRPATLSVRVRVAGVVCDLGSIDLGEAAGEADA